MVKKGRGTIPKQLATKLELKFRPSSFRCFVLVLFSFSYSSSSPFSPSPCFLVVVTICVPRFLFSFLRSFWHYFGVTPPPSLLQLLLYKPPPAPCHCPLPLPLATCHLPAVPCPLFAVAACHANKFKYALCGCRLNKFVSPRRVLCNSPHRHAACGLGQVSLGSAQSRRVAIYLSLHSTPLHSTPLSLPSHLSRCVVPWN